MTIFHRACALLVFSSLTSLSAFLSPHPVRQKFSARGSLRPRSRNFALTMRDRSASSIPVGAIIRVSSDVSKKNFGNLRGRTGIVVSSWEKCDVDPTCCCAEFVDENYAIMVKFDDGLGSFDSIFTNYFAEHEVDLVNEEKERKEKEKKDLGAFDGMSCKAFKLQYIKQGGGSVTER